MSRIMKALILGGTLLLCLPFLSPESGDPREGPSLLPPAAPPEAPQGGRDLARDNQWSRRDYQRLRLADPATGRIPPDIHRLEQEFAAKLEKQKEDRLVNKAVAWESRGPWNVGGRTRALAIDVSDPTYQTLLAGGVSGGMWRSIDDGANWTLTTGSSQLHGVTSVAQDTRPGHQNTWYYGTGESEGPSTAWPTGEYWHNGDGIFKSTDGGVSWSLLEATSGHDPQTPVSPFQFINRLAVDPSNAVNEEIYAATWGFIMRSVDGGTSFTPVLGDPTTPASYTEVVVTSDGIVYATLSYDGGTHGTFRSIDGINWTDITPPGVVGYDRIILAVAPSNENIVWFQVSNSLHTPDAALFRYQYLSGNGSGAGGSWSDRSSHLASLPWNGSTTFLDNQDNYCQALTVHPSDPETVFLGGVNLYRGSGGFTIPGSIDWVGGWLYGNHHADQHSLVFKPGSSEIAYSGSDGGVHKTVNIQAAGVTWTSLNNGYNTCQFYTAAIDQNLPGSQVIIGGMQDNGSWFSGLDLPEHSWTETLGGDGGFCAVADASGQMGTYYVSYQQNYGVFRYGLNNATGAIGAWTRVDPIGADTPLWLKPFILDPNDTDKMYLAGDETVWRNSDLTAIPDYNNQTTSINWVPLTTAPGAPVTALAMSHSTNRILYFGNAIGQVFQLNNADTVGPGSTSVRLDVGAGFPSGAYVSSIAVHPHDDQQVLVAFSNYNVTNIFFSDDGGVSWSDVEGNLGGSHSPSVRSVVFMPAMTADFYFVATSTGLYSSFLLDGASTVWHQEGSSDIGRVVVDMVTVRPSDKLVVAATHGKGVYQGYLGASGVTFNSPAGGIRLDQNVPNPFNPRTTIRFGISEPGAVTVKVFDISGRCVKNLLDGFRDAGNHTLEWQGDDNQGRPLGSGMYLCRVSSGGKNQTRTMTLVR